MLVVGFVVTACLLIKFRIGVDQQISATSRALSTFYWLRLGVFRLLVMTFVELQMRTAKWQHLSFRLIFIELIYSTAK